MKRSKFSQEQITYALRQAEGGTPVGDVCQQLGVSESTFYVRKKKYVHLGAAAARRFVRWRSPRRLMRLEALV